MSNVLVINGHQPYPFAKGKLNATLTERARAVLADLGNENCLTSVAEGYDVEAEIAAHQWADVVLMQFPVNWMGVPWSFKRYMDEVNSVGMDGRMTRGDGRTAEAPNSNYGMGGTLGGTRYMLSATLKAPREAFDDPAEPFFAGMSLDDLLRPMHLHAKFFAMAPLPTFAALDVMKKPEVKTDLDRFEMHLREVFATDAQKEADHVAA